MGWESLLMHKGPEPGAAVAQSLNSAEHMLMMLSYGILGITTLASLELSQTSSGSIRGDDGSATPVGDVLPKLPWPFFSHCRSRHDSLLPGSYRAGMLGRVSKWDSIHSRTFTLDGNRDIASTPSCVRGLTVRSAYHDFPTWASRRSLIIRVRSKEKAKLKRTKEQCAVERFSDSISRFEKKVQCVCILAACWICPMSAVMLRMGTSPDRQQNSSYKLQP